MEDLTQYIPANDDWINDEIAHAGEKETIRYYNKVYNRLVSMKPGERLYIEEVVHPENYQLFIRMVCTAIRELANHDNLGWFLENQATEILRDF
jgi:hypothetical protein